VIHNGDLIVTEGNIEYASALTSVNGDLIVDAAGADFPFLFFVAGDLHIQAPHANLAALERVGGIINIQADHIWLSAKCG
jgi:hypothetical protein